MPRGLLQEVWYVERILDHFTSLANQNVSADVSTHRRSNLLSSSRVSAVGTQKILDNEEKDMAAESFKQVWRQLWRVIPYSSPTKLGRWNRLDNVDIKATLANIDSCGDRLCGDVRETRAVIEKYRRSPGDIHR